MTARNDFGGSQVEVCSSDQTLSDGEFLVDGTNGTITPFDNSIATRQWTSARLTLTATPAADPGTDATIDVYIWETDVDGTKDEVPPTVADKQGADWVESFRIPDDMGTTEFSVTLLVSLVGVKLPSFSIVPREGENVADMASGVTVKIEGASFNDS